MLVPLRVGIGGWGTKEEVTSQATKGRVRPVIHDDQLEGWSYSHAAGQAGRAGS
jgi:hypothetical protein